MKPIHTIETNRGGGILSHLPHRKAAILYGEESPLTLSLPEHILNTIDKPIMFDVLVDAGGEYTFSGVYKKEKFQVFLSQKDNTVRLPFGELRVDKRKANLEDGMKIRVTINHPQIVANNYLGNLEIELTSKTSSVADITLVSQNMALGRAFLDVDIKSYNDQGI